MQWYLEKALQLASQKIMVSTSEEIVQWTKSLFEDEKNIQRFGTDSIDQRIKEVFGTGIKHTKTFQRISALIPEEKIKDAEVIEEVDTVMEFRNAV